MKKIFRVLCTVILCVSLASCGKQAAKKQRIGILAPAVTHGWVAAVAFFAEQRCKELGDEIDYKLLTSSTAEEMTAQLDELKAWNADAIVAYPQWTGMEVPISSAIQQGIKVVNFDIEIKADGIYMVSGDNESMGIESAKYIVEKCGKNATIVTLPVPTSGSVSELRMKGFMDTIKQIAPEAKLIERSTKFTREDGLKDFADILTANPHIDAVFSLDDETSIGVLQAIKEAGRSDIKVVTGGGGCQEYFNMMPGNENIWIQSALYSPSMVKEAVNAALALLKNEEVPAKKIIPTTIVDRSNCADFLNANSPY